jgi:DNA-binding transcriptional MerR regulator
MATGLMMIGQLAQRTATKVTTIRFYETIGLLPAPPRTESGRRTYGAGDVQRLQFVRNGRRLGFSIGEIRSLIDLAESPNQDCSAASTIASRHLEDVESRLAQLASLRDELASLSRGCTNRQIADCRIIQAIAEPHAPSV